MADLGGESLFDFDFLSLLGDRDPDLDLAFSSFTSRTLEFCVLTLFGDRDPDADLVLFLVGDRDADVDLSEDLAFVFTSSGYQIPGTLFEIVSLWNDAFSFFFSL